MAQFRGEICGGYNFLPLHSIATTKPEAFDLMSLWLSQKKLIAYGAELRDFRSFGSGFINVLRDERLRIGFEENQPGPPAPDSSIEFSLSGAQYEYAEIPETQDTTDSTLIIRLPWGMRVMLCPVTDELNEAFVRHWSGI
jgi:hypothetical protein